MERACLNAPGETSTGMEENDRGATERRLVNRDRRATSLHFLEKSLASPVWLHPNRPLGPLEFDPIHFRGVVSPSIHLISADELSSIARCSDHYLSTVVSLFKDCYELRDNPPFSGQIAQIDTGSCVLLLLQYCSKQQRS